MVMGLVPRLTVDDNLIAGNDGFPQDLAAAYCFVCGVVECAVGEVGAVVDDDVLTVDIQFGQDTFLFSMLVVCAVPLVVVSAIVVAVVFAIMIGVGIHRLAVPGRRGRGRFRAVVAISRIESRKIDACEFARIGGWTLGAAL